MRGTTPIHTFKLAIEAEQIKKVKVAYHHNGKVHVVKNTSDCTIKDGKLSCRLSRSETIRFPDNVMVGVQAEIETHAGDSLKTPVYYINSGVLLDEGELE